jgi:hypothetical protein
LAGVAIRTGAEDHTMRAMSTEQQGFYPRPVHPPVPEETRERAMREFAQKQAESHRRILAERKRRRDAAKAGKPIKPQEMGPLW